MEEMSLGLSRRQPKIYVILRVSNLIEPVVNMNILVDPFRFKGNILDFEAEQWFAKIR